MAQEIVIRQNAEGQWAMQTNVPDPLHVIALLDVMKDSFKAQMQRPQQSPILQARAIPHGPLNGRG